MSCSKNPSIIAAVQSQLACGSIGICGSYLVKQEPQTPSTPHVRRINHNRSIQHNDPIRAKSKRPSAGKLATDTKCVKTCSLFQARENVQPGAKRGGKLCRRYHAPENGKPVPSAGKQEFSTKRGKMRVVNQITVLLLIG